MEQRQQQQPFICTHTTYKIITINTVNVIREYGLPKITIRAKKNGETLSYMEYLYRYRSVTHLHTHTHKDTNRKVTYSGTKYILN